MEWGDVGRSGLRWDDLGGCGVKWGDALGAIVAWYEAPTYYQRARNYPTYSTYRCARVWDLCLRPLHVNLTLLVLIRQLCVPELLLVGDAVDAVLLVLVRRLDHDLVVHLDGVLPIRPGVLPRHDQDGALEVALDPHVQVADHRVELLARQLLACEPRSLAL